MPARRIHFTGRQRLTAQDVGIILHNEAVPLAFQISHLSLQRHDLPEDALVRVEAYRRTTYMRFDLGTVADLRSPGRLELTEFALPDAIRFRVKVTSVAGDIAGQLLAVGDHIRPAWTDSGQESLLPVRPDSSLDQEVFRLIFDDEPMLLINDKVTQWRALSLDEHFVSLVYPTALRTILARILHDDRADSEESEDWRALWIRFAKGHSGISDPPDDEGEHDLSINDWIDDVVVAFCKRNRIYDAFAQRWDSEENS